MPSSRRPRRRRLLLLGGLAALLLVPAACVIGPEQDPGCHQDSECDPGWLCREGACFHVTTGTSPPRDPVDAGDAG